jgi:hypothetical protein
MYKVLGSIPNKKSFITVKKKLISSWAWWYMPVIPAIRGLSEAGRL